jgi:hypothetical protein
LCESALDIVGLTNKKRSTFFELKFSRETYRCKRWGLGLKEIAADDRIFLQPTPIRVLLH